MSLFDSVFGAGASQNIFGGHAIQPDYSMNAQRDTQLQAQYSSAQQRRFVSHNWVFDGKPCSLHEFADSIWGEEDHPDKMIFILTHSGPKSLG
ncbi:hypothetical protein UFOVP1369_15 [uncultured Caudovirales phage]|uniref:Uncharacterized protein n=1 Tax=uncultured Caudovirales phage TaxID=2100421 RepID=A0A6J5RVM3_9CAUD|nr:hypothetical protein UFOVP1369_15 [uncultured Caudovirales phage]